MITNKTERSHGHSCDHVTDSEDGTQMISTFICIYAI